MQGHDVNISNIEKNIRNEYNEVKRKFRQSSAYRKGEEYLERVHKRDRTALIITSVIVGVILLANFVNIPYEPAWNPAFHFNFPFSHFGFPGIFPLVLILLILGLAFRSALKGFLILIAVVLLAAFLFKILGVFAWPHMMHTFM
jgi:hypothetical protein